MRKVSKTASRMLNILCDGLTEPGDHKTIDNSKAFMPVLVNVLSPGPYTKTDIISVAHRGTQNGDSMRDPDMEFLRDMSGEDIEYYPLAFYNDYARLYQSFFGYTEEGEVAFRNCREQREAAAFTTIWMKNIKHQQGI